MLRDRRRLRRLSRGERAGSLRHAIDRSRQLVEQRRLRLPAIHVDSSLPISAKWEEIATAITNCPVTIVVGETGSGKSTQLPKLCLGIGRGVRGLIGHTQPRRIAARSVAARVAKELQTDLGDVVGYKIRFRDRVGSDAYVKVLTDGMLLAELESDRELEHYDTIILDEAHERSLNIDFLLGYMQRLLPRRPDLKLIITSATIDPQRFSEYFDGAPVIEVSGKTWPVEVRYQDPAGEEQELEIEPTIAKAINKLPDAEGDVLVFVPGEKEIRQATSLLRKLRLPRTQILPLYARLSIEQQQEVFKPCVGRRIVLATNVAETSLTVPGIRYVIDSGLARISRHRPGRQIQALPIERISQASANQRKGRCGRVARGVCIRLYSETDFLARPEFTEPEILRTSLAAVILRMHQLGLGEIETFPFIEPPTPAMIRDGYRLLEELGAIDSTRSLTPLGRRLARIPLDPRLGRIVLAADHLGCVAEALIVCAALSVRDPRLYPEDAEQTAREHHCRYEDPNSDFLTYLHLWRRYHEQTRGLTRRQKQAYCGENYLSQTRMIEWQDVHKQLLDLAKRLRLSHNNQAAERDVLHQALLSGYLGYVGRKQERNEYLGTRGQKFLIHPASRRRRSAGEWVLCGELVDTNRLYGRTVAAVQPEWIETAAAHLVRREHLNPYWDEKRGKVLAFEQVSLYGLPVIFKRRVPYETVDPVDSRAIFIRQALVSDQLGSSQPFQKHNRALIDQIQQLEHKARRHDILIADESLFDFFDMHVPVGICNRNRFLHWYQRTFSQQPEVLYLSKESLMRHAAEHVTQEQFPNLLLVQGNELQCRYHFAPGHPNDGITVSVPQPLVSQLTAAPFSWLVPGLLLEKIIFLLRKLPKTHRRHLVPITGSAERCLQRLSKQHGSLTASLSRTLEELFGIRVGDEDWDERGLPEHLRVNFEVLDEGGQPVAYGRSIEALRARLEMHSPMASATIPTPDIERSGLAHWDFGDLPGKLQTSSNGTILAGYPTLVDDNTSVSIKVMNSPEESARHHRHGVMRLLLLQLPQHARQLRKGPADIKQMCLNFAATGRCDELRQDLIDASLVETLFDEGDIRTEAAFHAKLDHARRNLIGIHSEISELVHRALELYRICWNESEELNNTSRDDIRQQLKRLVFVGFVEETGLEVLRHMPRYLQAIQIRIERARREPAKDEAGMALMTPLNLRLNLAEQSGHQASESLREYRWLVEEYRVSIFAQSLGTALPVSAKRLDKKWHQIQLKKES